MLVKSYSIPPVRLQRIMKKALFLHCFKVFIDHLFNTYLFESGKRNYCFGKVWEKSELWIQKSLQTLWYKVDALILDFSLRVSFPIWASELEPRENARAIVGAARGRGKELSFLFPTPRFRVSSRVPLARLLFMISPNEKLARRPHVLHKLSTIWEESKLATEMFVTMMLLSLAIFN